MAREKFALDFRAMAENESNQAANGSNFGWANAGAVG